MPIVFDRGICCDLNETISREWLVTNGLGGYAAGTVAGALTRMQHGLLVAAFPDALTPQLLLAKIDEEVVFDQRTYYLGTNEYRDGTLNPAGFVHLETFQLEEGFPVFTYHLGGINRIMLEKRIWMPRGLNTTCIQYRVLRTAANEGGSYRRGTTGMLSSSHGRFYEDADLAQRALTLTLLPFAAHRPYDQPQYGSNDKHFHIEIHRTVIDKGEFEQPGSLPAGVTGCTLRLQDDTASSSSPSCRPYHILVVAHPDSHATFIPTGVWYWNFLRRHEAAAGLHATDDLYLPGVFRATLWPAEDAVLTIIVSAEELSSQPLRLDQLNLSYNNSVERQQRLFSTASQPQRYFGEGGEAARADHLRALPLTTTPDPHEGGEEYLRFLLQAADRYLAERKLPLTGHRGDGDIPSGWAESAPVLLSDYYTLQTHTRDMLVALPGLALVTGRHDDALKLLRELARHFKGGLLPDRLPLPGSPLQDSDWGSVDTALWFFYALDHYLRITRNYTFLEEFYYRLTECIDRYAQGTRHGIQVDPRDGLLRAKTPGKALTWMNAAVEGIPVTPRMGKPVEVNALWYHALALMQGWSQRLSHLDRRDHSTAYYETLLTRCKQSFQQRFWNTSTGYLYDVVDGPDGDDPALRPNQLFALSLRYPVLDSARWSSVFDAVTRHLLTSYGLRTLAPHEPEYRGRGGDRLDEQQRALHQGSVLTWLIGPYVEAMLNVHRLPPSSINGQEGQDEQLYQEYLWRRGLRLLEPFKGPLEEGLLGMSAGVLDGDPPHTPVGPAASALSTASLLHIYNLLAYIRISHSEFRRDPIYRV